MPTTFNQDAYVAAIQPPVYIAGGREFRGVILSADEFFAFVERAERVSTSDVAGQRRLVREFFDLVFPPAPRPRIRWWRRLLGRVPARTRSVGELVALLPLRGQLEAFQSFCQAQATLNGTPPAPKTTTPTPDSAS